MRDLSRRRIPGRDRQHVAPATRQQRLADRQAHLGGHRRPRLPCAPARTARPWRTCPQGTLVAITGGKDRRRTRQRSSSGSTRRSAKYADIILVHGGGPGVEKHRRASWAERNGVHQIVCKPDWDRSRTGRTVPPQRRTPEPPAEGRHRVPRQRHHREPRRQGPPARHSGSAHRGLSAHRYHGPRHSGGAVRFLWSDPNADANRTARLRFARRLRRRAPRRQRRFSSARPRALAASPATARASSPPRFARRQCPARADDVADVGGDVGGAADADPGYSDADEGADSDADGGAEDGYQCGEPYDEAWARRFATGLPCRARCAVTPLRAGIPRASVRFAHCALRLPGGSLRSPPRAEPPPSAQRSTNSLEPPPRSPRAGASRSARCTRAGAPAEHARSSLRTAQCSRTRTSASITARASGSVLRTTACGSGRTVRHSIAVAAPIRRVPRRRSSPSFIQRRIGLS